MIITCGTAKGGVGKTTFAVHCAAWLQEQNQSVLLIDGDTGRSSSKWNEKLPSPVPCQRSGDPDELVRLIHGANDQYEYVVVDGPGNNLAVTRTLFCVTDLAVLPCGASFLDTSNLADTLRLIETARATTRSIFPLAIFVPSKVKKRSVLTRELEDFGRELGIPTTSCGIRALDANADAPGQGSVAWRMNDKANAGADWQTVIPEVIRYGETQLDGYNARRAANA